MTKQDARPITTTFNYDALNRAPTVTYTYGAAGVINSKGRLTSVSSSVSATNYTAYDAQGKPVSVNQITDGQTYSMSYGYNLAGSLNSLTYPSGRVIKTEYDSAGRMAGVRDHQTGVYYAGALGTDATNRMQYSAPGAVSVMKLGNGLWEHTNFNSRSQPTEIGVGTSATNSSTLGLTYNYGTTSNNGNLLSVSYAGGGLSYTQTFGYDELNRLTTSAESGSSWSQTNSYDRYGNRAIVGAALSFSTANNRISNAGYVYDAAGNLTNDPAQSFAFDAENKIKTVNGETDVYRYDGDGNRVRKNFTYGEKVRMVYSGGQLIAEYDLSNGSLKKEYVYGAKGLIATIEPANGTRYMTADHLGTLRVVTNSSAGVVSRHDYMPFGEEIGTGFAGRTSGMGFSVVDGVRQKFTSKERDNETGLDYFLARYYSSTQGRFTSPDEFTGGPDELFDFAEDASTNPTFYADLTNPQSLNKYQYTYNNPLNMVDPDGHCPDCPPYMGGPAGVNLGLEAYRNPSGALDVAQIVIGVVGIAPGVGEVADVVNAGVSLARGNKAEAALDLAGALGPVGSVAAVGNRIRKVGKVAKVANRLDNAAEVGADVSTGFSKGRKQVFKEFATRKEAIDARPRPLPAQKGERRITRQSKNKAGMGTKSEKHRRGGRHVHDDRHNKPKKPNKHYGFPD